ncbi:hypothetical protein Tco_1110561 [Tanacetum coccineum]|uniref:Integrase, catalytic region, zinc finger, CCHC-type, peptidase aspartic, catalytic n=1 Tax=Tanacetum coccineum TaxID=301880 RepID=A0ABQ5ILL5_9ASTR
MTGNLKLLSNFVKKFLGTVKFGNDQIAPILGYGDLVQGNCGNYEGGLNSLKVDDDFGVDVLRFQTCLTDILSFLEKLGWWFEQDIDDDEKEENEEDEDGGEV